MQYAIVLSLCLIVLLGGVVGQSNPPLTLSQADAAITAEAQSLEDTLLSACRNAAAANTAGGNAMQWAIIDAINNNAKPSQSASLAANASQAIARFIANFTQNDLAAAQALVSTHNLIARDVAGAMNSLTAAFDAARFTPAQQSAWVQQRRTVWLGFEIRGNQQCANEIAKSKASLDAVNNRLQRAIGTVQANPVLAAAIGQYVRDAINAAKASMDNDVAVLKGNEVLDNNIHSILRVA